MAPVEVDKVTGKLMNNACATKRMKKMTKAVTSHTALQMLCDRYAKNFEICTQSCLQFLCM
jgi:hypothetical protein